MKLIIVTCTVSHYNEHGPLGNAKMGTKVLFSPGKTKIYLHQSSVFTKLSDTNNLIESTTCIPNFP